MSGIFTKCVFCGQPFERGVNVFTDAGQRETQISGVCEKCFDAAFAEPGDSVYSPGETDDDGYESQKPRGDS